MGSTQAKARLHSMSGAAISDSHAHYSAAPSNTVGHLESFAKVQGWKERYLVEDSEASEENSEIEELPERQAEAQSYLPEEVLNDSFDFASTRPIFDNSQFELQDRLTSTVSPVHSSYHPSQEQPFDEFGVATHCPDLANLPQWSINEDFPARWAERDQQESQLCTSALRGQQGHSPNQPETVETVLVSQPIQLGARAALRLAFNTIGRLARDDSWITMDDGATQQASLPPTGVHTQKNTFSDFDRTDILCILIPATPTAYEAVELVNATAPHHILRRPRKVAPLKTKTPADQISVDYSISTTPKAKPSLDIALRMSSVILNPALGFTFGRNKLGSDLLICQGGHMRISQRHFRIYVNSRGSLMCQDTSTNGTYVDGVILRPKQQPRDLGDKRTLHNASVIELLVGQDMETMRFIVQVPDRSGVSQLYGSKLDQYIEFVEQMERRLQEENNRKAQPDMTDMSPAPVPQFSHMLRDDKLSTRANKVLIAGTEPFNLGMQWNGGDAYHVTALLGKGAFASVYKLTRRADGELFAAKEIRKTVFAQRGVLDRRVEQELNIVKQLQHPNIVQYIEHHETPEYLYILMELVEHGDLQSVLQARKVLSEFHCQAIASQMCEALKYLHTRDITHRDIKPDNILIKSNNPYVFKLSDFGLSKVVKNNETFLTSFCGTYLYCAPEVYPEYHSYKVINNSEPKRRSTKDRRRSKPKAKLPYTTAVDTWSIAAVLYHLLCGHPPYTGTTENYGEAILGNIMNNPVNYSRLRVAGVSQDAIDFLSRMLIIDPLSRMSDNACLGHRWIVPEKKPEDSSHLEIMTQAAARNDDFSTRDTERVEDDGDLLEFQHLASQLSIKNKLEDVDSEDLEEPPSEDLEEIEEMIESAGQTKQPSQDDELDSFDDYIDQYPSNSQIHRAKQAAANNNHLFGQISPAALRSSGALGREARRALEMPSHARGEFEQDESHYEGSSQISANDYPNTRSQPAPTDAQEVDSGEAAPSLLGAESMVDKLHMDSTMLDASDLDVIKQPSASHVEGANKQTTRPEVDKPSSTHSDDYLYTSTPPRSRRRLDEPSDSMRESKRVKSRHETSQAAGVESRTKDAGTTAKKTAHDKAATTAAVSADQSTSNFPAAPRTDHPAGQQDPTHTTTVTQTQAKSTPSSLTTKTHGTVVPVAIVEARTTTTPMTSIPPNTTTTQSPEFVTPPPPAPITYGTLTPTASSLPFSPITLKQRVTTFGRHHACDYTWPNALDTRVPKFALDIAFWRPRLERSLTKHPNLKWQNEKGLRTIIATRTSSAIFVNGAALTKKPDAEKGLRYGVLRTGDMVVIFDDRGKGGKGERLEFTVDIKIGKSKEKRKKGEMFEVVKDEDDGKGGELGSSQGSVGGGKGAELESSQGSGEKGNRKEDEKSGTPPMARPTTTAKID
ncbi:MAG: hypothetical protein Q9209_002450 [Squamulea sp. 1 TL-2023]